MARARQNKGYKKAKDLSSTNVITAVSQPISTVDFQLYYKSCLKGLIRDYKALTKSVWLYELLGFFFVIKLLYNLYFLVLLLVS